MNCQEFEQIVAELAADKLMSARARVTALAHTAACDSCGDRLSAEQALNRGLLGFASSTSGGQAPARLRQSLRAEFEAQARYVRNAAETEAPKVIQTPDRKPLFNWQWSWGLTAVAAAAIVIVIAVSVWQSRQAPSDETIAGGASATPTVTPLPEIVVPQNNLAASVETRKQTGETVKSKKTPQPRRQSVQPYENNLAANYIQLSYAAGSAT
ncbi:MAG: hypothetical protein AAB401_06835, partial [Acidobacteriota bacterium]